MTKRKQEEQIQAEKKKKFEEEKKIKERMRKELNDARKALRTFAKVLDLFTSIFPKLFSKSLSLILFISLKILFVTFFYRSLTKQDFRAIARYLYLCIITIKYRTWRENLIKKICDLKAHRYRSYFCFFSKI